MQNGVILPGIPSFDFLSFDFLQGYTFSQAAPYFWVIIIAAALICRVYSSAVRLRCVLPAALAALILSLTGVRLWVSAAAYTAIAAFSYIIFFIKKKRGRSGAK